MATAICSFALHPSYAACSIIVFKMVLNGTETFARCVMQLCQNLRQSCQPLISPAESSSESVFRSHKRTLSLLSLSQASSLGQPVCLICLDALTPDDFANGEAISLDCQCKGAATTMYLILPY